MKTCDEDTTYADLGYFSDEPKPIFDEEGGDMSDNKMSQDCKNAVRNHGKRIKVLEDQIRDFVAQGRLFKWFVGICISVILVSLPVIVSIFTDQMRESSKTISVSLDNFAGEISKGVEQRGRLDERMQNVEKYVERLDSRLSVIKSQPCHAVK